MNTSPQGSGPGASPAKFQHWREQDSVVEHVAAFRTGVVNLTGGASPEQLRSAQVSADYFRLFGASAKRLPYVECNLAGPNAPQASACTQAGVDTYPTWFINGRRYAVGQVLSLAELANATGFPDELATKTVLN